MRTFGTDPEFIVVDKDGKPTSAIDLVAGNICNRVKIKGHEFYHDNVMVECAVKPARTQKEAVKHIKECLSIYTDMLDPCRLSNSCAAFFDPDQLECDCEDEHFLCAKHFGCVPDTCAYRHHTFETTEMSEDRLRSCGGHIHLGGTGECLEGNEKTYMLVFMLDLLLAVPSLFIDDGELDRLRRSSYGQAGRFRNKDYGIEYRTLSNFWLKSPKLVKLVYDICMFAMDFVDSGKADEYFEFDLNRLCETQDGLKAWTFKKYSRKELVRCINEGDKNKGAVFLEKAQKVLGSKLAREVELVLGKSFDLHEEWSL